MALKTGIFSLALGALLLGSTARADDTLQLQASQNGLEVQVQGLHSGTGPTYAWGNGGQRYYRDGRWYRHSPQPSPRNDHGRYELKYVQQWVPGGYEQVWVPQDCRSRPRWGRAQCTGGYYRQQWVEGHYESVEQWVWVPYRSHRGSPAGYWYN